MNNKSKRQEYIDSVEKKRYKISEAMDIFNNSPKAKFEESLDVSIKLGIDPEKSDQNVRGATSLPSGSGKSCKVAVFVEGDLAKEAKEALEKVDEEETFEEVSSDVESDVDEGAIERRLARREWSKC